MVLGRDGLVTALVLGAALAAACGGNRATTGDAPITAIDTPITFPDGPNAADAPATDASSDGGGGVGKIAPVAGRARLGTYANPALGDQPVAIASLETTIGAKFAIHTSYWGFNGGDVLSQLGSNAAIADDVSNGRTPLLSWGCSSAKGVTFQAIADGTYDTDVVIPAAQAVKALGAQVFIRPSWEFNLNINNPTGDANGNNCYSAANVGNDDAQAAEYKAYFQHLVAVFAAQGATNATWMWCPAVSAADLSAHSLTEFYPGDDVVDWIGGDTYDKTAQPTRGFVGIWTPFFQQFGATGKPLMISETGEYNNATDGFTQQKFFTDAATALKPGGAFHTDETHRIDALVYFDSQAVQQFDWTVESPKDGSGEAAWATMAALPFFTRTAP